jgi:rsbT co-antagonist protein RsbR
MPAQELAALLADHNDAILSAWVDAALTSDLPTTPEQIRRELGELLDTIAAGLRDASTASFRDAGYDEARSLLAELSRARARSGATPTETASAIFGLKRIVAPLLAAGSSDAAADRDVLSDLVDEMGLFTFESFVAAREHVITEQAEQLLELSTPVVKLWDGVVAVPLVGTLDSARTQVVMEQLLQTLVDTGSQHAIIDITGVAAVDTQVAQHLLKTVVAARLMGAECIISGIRPQIAQTIVALGIQFGDVATKATLADALALALQQAGVVVVNKAASA